jgi:glutamate decarboxylase
MLLAQDIVKACQYLEKNGGNAKPPMLHAKEKTTQVKC